MIRRFTQEFEVYAPTPELMEKAVNDLMSRNFTAEYHDIRIPDDGPNHYRITNSDLKEV